jgi:hypothetical protein
VGHAIAEQADPNWSAATARMAAALTATIQLAVGLQSARQRLIEPGCAGGALSRYWWAREFTEGLYCWKCFDRADEAPIFPPPASQACQYVAGYLYRRDD